MTKVATSKERFVTPIMISPDKINMIYCLVGFLQMGQTVKACELLIFGGILNLHNVIKCFSQNNRNKFVIRMLLNQ